MAAETGLEAQVVRLPASGMMLVPLAMTIVHLHHSSNVSTVSDQNFQYKTVLCSTIGRKVDKPLLNASQTQVDPTKTIIILAMPVHLELKLIKNTGIDTDTCIVGNEIKFNMPAYSILS